MTERRGRMSIEDWSKMIDEIDSADAQGEAS